MGLLLGGHLNNVPAGGGDVIDLQDMSCDDSGVGNASAECRLYNAGTREGEQWSDDGGFIYHNDAITPGSNADNYQVKWDLLAGDAPDGADTVSAAGVWFALTAGDFRLHWEQIGEGDQGGSCTVSIREGTGAVLDTAVWDGTVEATKKGQ